MRLKKEIKEKPFQKYEGPAQCHFSVTGGKVKGEKVYIFDFVPNPKRNDSWYSAMKKPARLVIDQKQKDYYIFAEGERGGRVNITPLLPDIRWKYPEIDMKTETALRRALGIKAGVTTNNHFMPELATWCRELKEKRQEEIRQARGAFPDDYYDMCPTDIPQGFLQWIRASILPHDHTLVYKKGGWNGTCHICGRKVRARSITERFTHTAYRTCPDCGAEVYCVLKNGSLWRATNVENVCLMQKDVNGVVWFRLFHLRRDDDAQYEQLENFLAETARYAMKKGQVGYWQKYAHESRMWGAMEYELRDWMVNKRFSIYDGTYKFYPWNVDEVVPGTCLQYSSISDYLRNKKISPNVITYAQNCALYPVMEFLYKGGYYDIINDKVNRRTQYTQTEIRWKQRELKQCFKIPLNTLKLLEAEKWNLNRLHDTRELLEVLPPSKVSKNVLMSGLVNLHLKQALQFMTLDRYIKFIAGKKNRAHTYYDYLEECIKLKFDMKSKSVLFPKDLDAAHQRTMQMVDYEENKEKTIKFQKAVKRFEKLGFEDDGFLIRVAQTPAELKFEGQTLSHCVGGYADRVANKETAIFLVRQMSSPETPFYTLELKDKKIIQCRTKNNKSYEADAAVKSFVDMWYSLMILKEKKKTA